MYNCGAKYGEADDGSRSHVCVQLLVNSQPREKFKPGCFETFYSGTIAWTNLGEGSIPADNDLPMSN
jgi:hypothetical protein